MIDSFALFQWMNALQVINSNQLPILVDAIFIGSYFILINQLSQYAISPRRRRNIAEWVFVVALISQALQVCKLLTQFVRFIGRLYKQGEPYIIAVWGRTYTLPSADADRLEAVAKLLVASLLALLSHALSKRQQRYRITWFDVRRSYRNELGPSRYYLSRPIMQPQSSQNQNGRRRRHAAVKGSTSDDNLTRKCAFVNKVYPKLPRSA